MGIFNHQQLMGPSFQFSSLLKRFFVVFLFFFVFCFGVLQIK
ncbi:hypothetical protein, unlikely [Trypanosoma brucei brucei TREU927]|uniref:Uncharacterized protein n=1 Tax=Trypanosoma brucei brucei (strain 927/4 GUTat10.1) TaxID=185431 RepID=Q4GYW1_TRYB2|nr:hypothetical protein, unlikely [Trypanosoma brucei brucei TREU927]CAJ16405.1 hypothetical protein, unlikely [Trypanosoma brucei brucei TREU927]